MPKIKNIIIFVIIAIVLILIYVYFIKPEPDTATLISSSGSPEVPAGAVTDNNSTITEEFLTLLLSVKSIKLDDSIFTDPAFASLSDSTIVLTPDGNEGRPNPFAPFGNDVVMAPTITTPRTIIPTTATPNPAPNFIAPGSARPNPLTPPAADMP